MRTFSALLAPCEGNPPVTSEFPSQRPVTRMFPLVCAWANGQTNNRDAGDLRRHRNHYGVTVLIIRRLSHRLLVNWLGFGLIDNLNLCRAVDNSIKPVRVHAGICSFLKSLLIISVLDFEECLDMCDVSKLEQNFEDKDDISWKWKDYRSLRCYKLQL